VEYCRNPSVDFVPTGLPSDLKGSGKVTLNISLSAALCRLCGDDSDEPPLLGFKRKSDPRASYMILNRIYKKESLLTGTEHYCIRI
jgi:hypothetical protein